VDPDVLRLVREERLLEGAQLASARGDARTACDLYERACAWSLASQAAIAYGEPSRALLLAVEGADDEAASRALPGVIATAGKGDSVADQLSRRGRHAWAARVHEAAERRADAAREWERAGEAVRAAVLLDVAGDPIGASRVLEAALRREPEKWALHVALGKLLLRYGKAEPAARALQKVPREAAENREALTYLVSALDRIGLAQARAEAEAALAAAGGPAPGDDRAASPEGAAKRRIFGRYEVVRDVASTATARVLECTDPVRGERVAIKILAAYDARGGGRDALARFEREVRVLGALEHPNVVPLRDYVPEGPALVLAWMSGGTLEARLAAGALAPSRAVEIANAVLSALGEAHRLGVLHRDVKPANVLFDDAGVARLADFGVAHLGDLSATATAGVFGTLAYMSPEQREGRPASVQSDVFGVGVMLFEMLTGEKPVPNRPPLLRPSGVHRDLDTRHDAAVLRLFADGPDARPSDAFAARRELSALPWPSTIEPAAPRPASIRPASVRAPESRLEDRTDGLPMDRWMGRRVQVIPLTERTLIRAGAFARAAHRALQPVLRVDRARGEIWLGAHGPPLSRSLDGAEVRELRAALAALHAAGAVHGSVDARHVAVEADGAVTLLFAGDCDPMTTADLDQIALGRLG
jgi:serine/threonine-protein kinase